MNETVSFISICVSVRPSVFRPFSRSQHFGHHWQYYVRKIFYTSVDKNSRFPSFYCYKEQISIFSFSTMFVNVYWLLWLGKSSTKSSCLILFHVETDGVKTSMYQSVQRFICFIALGIMTDGHKYKNRCCLLLMM